MPITRKPARRGGPVARRLSPYVDYTHRELPPPPPPPVEPDVDKPPKRPALVVNLIGTLLILTILGAGIGGCMAAMSEGSAPPAPPAALAPDAAPALDPMPTAAIADAAPPPELPAPAVVGWWSPDGVPRPFAEPPVITALIGRCGGRSDLVLVQLADGSQVWLTPADAAATPELVAGMPIDVCAGVP